MSFYEVINSMFRKNRIALSALALLLAPALTLAQQGSFSGNGVQFSFRNPLGPNVNDLGTFLKLLLNFVTELAIPIIVLMLIYTGFKFVAAQGNSDKLAEARRILLWTLIGAGIILGANAILLAIQGTVTQIRGATGLVDIFSHLT